MRGYTFHFNKLLKRYKKYRRKLENKPHFSDRNWLQKRIDKLAKELQQMATRHKHLAASLATLGLIIAPQLAQAQTFGSEQQNPFGLASCGLPLQGYTAPAIVDIDADGDNDFFFGMYDGSFGLVENTGTPTNPSFTTYQNNPYNLVTLNTQNNGGYGSAPDFADIDNDGDLDLFVGTYYGKLAYYENIGDSANPNFTSQTAPPFGLPATSGNAYMSSFSFEDLDNDGDLDCFVNGSGGQWQYYENNGGAFTFIQNNPFGLSALSYGNADFVDIDCDGDLDMFAGDGPGWVKFSENLGNDTLPDFSGGFTSQPFGISWTNGYAQVAVADMDGDGDKDVWAGCNTWQNIRYWENTSAPCNQVPTISSASNQKECANNTIGPVTITLTDEDVNSVTVTATSNNQTLIPNGNISVTGTGGTRNINMAPVIGQSGIATITVEATDNFSQTTQTTFDITVNPLPVVDLGADTTICEGDQLVLDAGSGFTSYDWFDSSTNQTYTVSESAGTYQYYVEVTDNNGCSGIDTINVEVEVCVGVNEIVEPDELSMFPNPASAQVLINGGAKQIKQVTIFNEIGKTVFVEHNFTSNQVLIDVSGFVKGIYFVSVLVNQQVVQGKLIVK